MMAQFHLVRKDRPTFLGYSDHDEEEAKLVGRGLQSAGSKDPRRFIPDSIIEFDDILGKACNICQVNDLDREQRMRAWFQILRYLQDFMVGSSQKVSESLATAKKEFRNLDLVNLRENESQAYTDKLKEFIMERINYILHFPGLEIPLKMILEQLKLNFEQTKSLCNSKLKHNGTTLRIEHCA